MSPITQGTPRDYLVGLHLGLLSGSVYLFHYQGTYASLGCLRQEDNLRKIMSASGYLETLWILGINKTRRNCLRRNETVLQSFIAAQIVHIYKRSKVPEALEESLAPAKKQNNMAISR